MRHWGTGNKLGRGKKKTNTFHSGGCKRFKSLNGVTQSGTLKSPANQSRRDVSPERSSLRPIINNTSKCNHSPGLTWTVRRVKINERLLFVGTE